MAPKKWHATSAHMDIAQASGRAFLCTRERRAGRAHQSGAIVWRAWRSPARRLPVGAGATVRRPPRDRSRDGWVAGTRGARRPAPGAGRIPAAGAASAPGRSLGLRLSCAPCTVQRTLTGPAGDAPGADGGGGLQRVCGQSSARLRCRHSSCGAGSYRVKQG